jgi:hypothetical protein
MITQGVVHTMMSVAKVTIVWTKSSAKRPT